VRAGDKAEVWAFLFSGLLDGGSLKIQYNRNRYYDQYTGRWTTHDPMHYGDSMNLYEYGLGSPQTQADPMGLTLVLPIEIPPYPGQLPDWPEPPFPPKPSPREEEPAVVTPGAPDLGASCDKCENLLTAEPWPWPRLMRLPPGKPFGHVDPPVFDVLPGWSKCNHSPACYSIVLNACSCKVTGWYYGHGRGWPHNPLGSKPFLHEKKHYDVINNTWLLSVRRKITAIGSKGYCVCEDKARCYGKALEYWVDAYRKKCDCDNYESDRRAYRFSRDAFITACNEWRKLESEAITKENECDAK
jgi:RHS repeat-associated protein